MSTIASLRACARHFAGVSLKTLLVAGIGAGTLLPASTTAPGQPGVEDGLVLEKAESWAPRAKANPVVSASKDDEVAIGGNGSRLCCGD